jgi:hypothetical protein
MRKQQLWLVVMFLPAPQRARSSLPLTGPLFYTLRPASQARMAVLPEPPQPARRPGRGASVPSPPLPAHAGPAPRPTGSFPPPPRAETRAWYQAQSPPLPTLGRLTPSGVLMKHGCIGMLPQQHLHQHSLRRACTDGGATAPAPADRRGPRRSGPCCDVYGNFPSPRRPWLVKGCQLYLSANCR